MKINIEEMEKLAQVAQASTDASRAYWEECEQKLGPTSMLAAQAMKAYAQALALSASMLSVVRDMKDMNNDTE